MLLQLTVISGLFTYYFPGRAFLIADIPYMDGPGGCPPLGTDLSGEPRNSPIPGMLPTTEVV